LRRASIPNLQARAKSNRRKNQDEYADASLCHSFILLSVSIITFGIAGGMKTIQPLKAD
jgi:hypothetical protein